MDILKRDIDLEESISRMTSFRLEGTQRRNFVSAAFSTLPESSFSHLMIHDAGHITNMIATRRADTQG